MDKADIKHIFNEDKYKEIVKKVFYQKEKDKIDYENKSDDVKQKIINGDYDFDFFQEKLVIKDRENPPRLIATNTLEQKIVLKYINEYLKDKLSIKLETPNEKVQKLYTYLKEYDNYDNIIIYKFDIKNFFPSITKEDLYSKLNNKIDRNILNLIKNCYNTPIIPNSKGKEKEDYKQNDKYKVDKTKGLHQGVAISNILSEFFLTEFDEKIKNIPNIKYLRYVDDIMIIKDKKDDKCIKTLLEESLKKILEKSLKKIKLEINEKKYDKFTIKENPIKFLGYELKYNENKKIFNISIAEDKLKKKLTEICKQFHFISNRIEDLCGENNLKTNEPIKEKRGEYIQNMKQAGLIEIKREIYGMVYNEKLYGWLNYYSIINDDEIFGKMWGLIKKQCEKYKFNNNPIFTKDNFESLFNAKIMLMKPKKIDKIIAEWFPDSDIKEPIDPFFPDFHSEEVKKLIRYILKLNKESYENGATDEKLLNLYNKFIAKKLNKIKMQSIKLKYTY